MDTISTSGIGCGGDDATLTRGTANDEGLAFERRVILFFYRTEEGVEVEVEDFARHC
jgi:hypothetical protein